MAMKTDGVDCCDTRFPGKSRGAVPEGRFGTLRIRLQLETLEPRMLLSTSPAPTAPREPFELGHLGAAAIIYVDGDATGNRDGSSWADAYSDLQDALAAAADGDEIRVAQGVYAPAAPGGSREATFRLVENVTLAGGYAGFGQPDPHARDVTAYETVLTGDLDRNDAAVADPADLAAEPTRAENSCHVVTVPETIDTARLDGFTITAGNANGEYPSGDENGGGINFHDGGGANAAIVNCTIRENSARSHGGGLYGGHILIDCDFINNSAGRGGGARFSDVNPVFTGCRFVGNHALAGSGGGLAGADGNPTLVNCAFTGNRAEYDGGGMESWYCNPTLVNCTFSGNTAGRHGGGLYAERDSVHVTNCVFSGNRDGSGTGESAELFNDGANVDVNYSCVRGWTGLLEGTGNVGGDPLFADADGIDNLLGTEDDDLHLLPQSPCLDAGDNDAIAGHTLDLDGNPRRVDHPGTPDTGNPGNPGPPVVDMGAYENAGQGFLLNTRSVVVAEEAAAAFLVALAEDPLGPVEVTVAWVSGDPNVTVAAGATLTFDGLNYMLPQAVALVAADDADHLDGTARIEVTAAGFSAAVVTATEADNDVPTTAVLYVDADAPGGNGASWSDAYTGLNDALTVAALHAAVVGEIRVAQGVYTPAGADAGGRATFELVSGVAVRGGYAGFGELDPDARDVVQRATILSGDLAQDDVRPVDLDGLSSEPSRAENCFHVVTASGTDATTLLEGFTVTSGQADASGQFGWNDGGGLYNEGGDLTIADCIFTGNATRGYGYYGSLGSAMYNSGGAAPTLVNCTFTANCSDSSNGALANYNGSPTLRGCSFIGNSGGGLTNFSEATLVDCTLLGNWTRHRYSGAGMKNVGGDPTLVNCIFSGNAAARDGGGLLVADGRPTLVNCTISGNSAGDRGGGVHTGRGHPSLVNCILAGNVDGGGTDESAQIDGGAPSIDYSCVQGWTGSLGGTGNIGDDPLFIDADGPDDVPGTPDDNLRLSDDSLCINTGDNGAVPPWVVEDPDGNPRITGRHVDLGAYECQSGQWVPPIIYVDADAAGNNDGTSWTDACNDLQDALAIAIADREIRVAEGVYTPAEPDGDRQATFQLITGVTILGGYAGVGQPDPDARDADAYPTVLSGDLNGDDGIGDHFSDNAYHVVTASGTDTNLLDGFAITAGNANPAGNDRGGGIYCLGGAPVVSNCSIVDNAATSGGGIYLGEGCAMALTGCTVSGNSADNGGGIYLDASDPTISNCTIWGNQSTSDGGGIYCQGNSRPTIAGCVVADNRADRNGGGISSIASAIPTITSSWFDGNEAGRYGGGYYYAGAGDPTVTACTFSGNTARDGGAIYVRDGSTMTVAGCTINDNSARSGGGIYSYASHPTIRDCTISDNEATSEGGGIYCSGESRPTTVTCTISGNRAGEYGGGIVTTLSAAAIIDTCTIVGNGSDYAGGYYCATGDSTVAGSTFTGNTATYAGGAVLCGSSAEPTLTDCTFSENEAGDAGAAISSGGRLTLVNCAITDNRPFVPPIEDKQALRGGALAFGQGTGSLLNCLIADNSAEEGGALWCGAGSHETIEVILVNCTIAGNSATRGGGIACNSSSQTAYTEIFLSNSILFNDGDEVWNNDGANVGMVYSDVEGGWRGSNIDADPRFVDPAGGDYRLLPGSPCIDAADNMALPRSIADDLDGNPRYLDDPSTPDTGDGTPPIIDMGAYELQYVSRIYVDLDAPGNNDGSSWADAYTDLQDALAAADRGDEIRVAEGVYTPAGPGGDRQVSFQLAYRVSVLGGYAGFGEPDPDARDVDLYPTVLSGDLNGDDAEISDPEDLLDHPRRVDNSYHVVRAGGLLDGFTIRGGNANSEDERAGGGIAGGQTAINCTFIHNAALYGGAVSGEVRLTDCTFRNNFARRRGGAVSAGDGSSLTRCTFVANAADNGGAAAIDGDSTVRNCTFNENSAQSNGGAIYHHLHSLSLSESTFIKNTANGPGGALLVYDSYPRVSNCTFVGNAASSGSAIEVGIDGELTLANCTLTANQIVPVDDKDGRRGGALAGIVTATNCILWGNGLQDFGGKATVNYSCIQGWDNWGGGVGNTGKEPRFVDADGLDNVLGTEDDDLRLLPDSPCIDAGDNTADPGSVDRDGNPRRVNDFRTPDTGNGTPPIVDMGAYEFQFTPWANVVGRHVFYNNSAFDGNDPAANELDDEAIAPDKAALLPGGTATLANYTSYSRGINGIMIDVANLTGTPHAGDFRFRVGTHGDPAGWSDAPPPSSVTVRPGQGVGGSDRVTLVWADNTIQKQWLQVTVWPGRSTGLAEPDVFYFGNAIGECGNSTTEAKVTAVDMLAARNNQRNFLDPAPIDFPLDFDRNARVNATDMLIARDNPTHFLNALRLITAPGGKGAPEDTGGLQQEPAHDAILRQAADNPGGPDAPLAKLGWLYEYEPLSARIQDTTQHGSSLQILDKLLAVD